MHVSCLSPARPIHPSHARRRPPAPRSVPTPTLRTPPNMRLTPTHSLRSAVLALVLVSCTSDRALGPETAPSPGRGTVVSLPNSGLVITEVMPDPSKVGDTAGEWFELYNASADTIDLKGLEIVSAAGLTASEKHFIGT